MVVDEKSRIWEWSAGILKHQRVKDRENDFAVDHGIRVDFRHVGIAEIRRAGKAPPVVEIRECHVRQRPVYAGQKAICEGGDIDDFVHFLT